MSTQAMGWAIEQQIVKEPTDRHVLICIANYVNQKDLTAFPSNKKLCTDTGFGERTIQRSINELLKLKIIEVVKQTENSNFDLIPLNRQPRIFRLNISLFEKKSAKKRGDTQTPQKLIRGDTQTPQKIARGVTQTSQNENRGVIKTPQTNIRDDLKSSQEISNDNENPKNEIRGDTQTPQKIARGVTQTSQSDLGVPHSRLRGDFDDSLNINKEPLINLKNSFSLKPLTEVLKDENEKNKFINQIISEEHKKFCKANNLNLRSQSLMFIEHHLAKGSIFSDWSSALMLWLRRAKDQYGIENSNAIGEDEKENDRLQQIFNDKYPDRTYFRAVETNMVFIKKEGKYLISKNEENRFLVMKGYEAMRAIEANKIVLLENKG